MYIYIRDLKFKIQIIMKHNYFVYIYIYIYFYEQKIAQRLYTFVSFTLIFHPFPPTCVRHLELFADRVL